MNSIVCIVELIDEDGKRVTEEGDLVYAIVDILQPVIDLLEERNLAAAITIPHQGLDSE